jgi:hypothetical protein
MRVWKIIACSVIGVSSLVATAQMGSTSAKAHATESIATPAAAYDAQLNIIQREMMGLVEAMPAEKFGFAPHAAIFVPGQTTQFATVRTFAQQATHVAQVNYLLYGIVSGLEPDVDTKAIGKLTKKPDVVAALAASFVFAHKAVATLTLANAFQVVKSPQPGIQTRATTAGFGVAHAFDHYGQMVEYLRMDGIVP